MVKTICERCQETGGIIKFPSLIIWIVMYYFCPEGSPVFREPTRFEMHCFKPFSQKGTLHELAQGKVFLETWFQQLKVWTTRWRVPQNIRRNLPADSHIQLALDHTSVWYMRGQDPKAKDLDYYPTVEQIFRELTRQAGTKVPIPEAATKVDFSTIEPLTDQEKEEDYELNLYINTFVSKDSRP